MTMEGESSVILPMGRDTSTIFRSILPHEPLPGNENGYLQLQGALEPKNRRVSKSGTPGAEGVHDAVGQDSSKNNIDNNDNDDNDRARRFVIETQAMRDAIRSSPVLSAIDELVNVEILDKKPPLSKIRLTYGSQQAARRVMMDLRSRSLSPKVLFSHLSPTLDANRHPVETKGNERNDDDDGHNVHKGEDDNLVYSSRQMLITPITTAPAPLPEISWTRSNPPKFRRLLHREGVSLEEERRQARFVFITNLLESKEVQPPSVWNDPHNVMDAVRRLLDPYDTSGSGVEVFIPNKHSAAYHCHVGMRSPEDARTVISALQGLVVKWEIPSPVPSAGLGVEAETPVSTVQSGRLFLDFAAITQRSQGRAKRTAGGEVPKGEPSRSACTSTTDHVVVPGLVLVEDFVDIEQEQVLMAVLTGPHAPWAPSQANVSQTGHVKRRVQH